MTLQEQGRRIFWLVRALVIVGGVIIIFEVLRLDWALAAIRKDRLQIVQESHEITQTLTNVRQLVEDTRTQLVMVLDGGIIPEEKQNSVTQLNHFVDNLTNASSNVQLLCLHSFITLHEEGRTLHELWQQTLAWRQRSDPVTEDVAQQRTINAVRTRIRKLREVLHIFEGEQRLAQAVVIKKLRAHPTQTSLTQDSLHFDREEVLQRQIDITDQDLMELRVLVERLYGETSLDNFPDLLDNRLIPVFDHFSQSAQAIMAASGVTDEYKEFFSKQSIDDLRTLILGDKDDGHSNSISLLTRQRQRLQLMQERELLEDKVNNLYQKFNQTSDELRNIEQTQAEITAPKLDANISQSRWQAILTGFASFLIFAWMAWHVSKHVQKQVEALDRARVEAEKNREAMAVMLEKQNEATEELSAAHDNLKESEQRFRQLSESAPIGILEFDIQGHCLYVNAEWTKITNLPTEQSAQNKIWSDLIHSDDRVSFGEWKKIVDEKGLFNMLIRLVMGDGSIRWVQSNIIAIHSEQNRTIGYVATMDNVTERKKNEEEKQFMEMQLHQAQKLEAIGQLAAGIAHEINTPMQFICDNTLFLSESFDVWVHDYEKMKNSLVAVSKEVNKPELALANDDAATLVKDIPKAINDSIEGINRVIKIVHAMKEFSHPGKQEKGAVNLNKSIENTVLVASNEWKYVSTVVTDFDPQLPLVLCYRDELNQVVLNLIVNSAHAIGDVVGKSGKKGTITISTRQDGAWVEIRLKDTGAGIPEKIQDKVFDPFFTTKPVGKGTGQGLAIAHAVIVKKHGGTIRFESKVGEGTTFIIRLPIHDESAKESSVT